MYMTNLYAYDKKLYLIIKDMERDFWESWEYERERSREEISRGDILGASENRREEKKKKEKRRGERGIVLYLLFETNEKNRSA